MGSSSAQDTAIASNPVIESIHPSKQVQLTYFFGQPSSPENEAHHSSQHLLNRYSRHRSPNY